MPGRRPAGVARFMRPVRSVRSVRPVRAAAVRSVRFFRASIRFRFSCRFGPGEDARTETPGRLFLTSKVASTPFHRTGCGGEDRFGFCRDGERPRGGGLPLPPPRVQCRFAFGEVRCGIYPRKKKLFFAGPGAEAKTGSGSAETENGRGGLAVAADPCAVQVCLRGGPMRNISSEEEAVFRRAGRRAEVCPIVSKKERRRPVRAVFSCRFLLRTQPAEHGPGGRRSENRRMLEECRFWRLRVLAGRAVQRPAIRKTSDVRRGVGCGGEGAIAGRTARKRRNSLCRPVGTDGAGASQLGNRSPPILLRESAGEAPVRWW